MAARPIVTLEAFQQTARRALERYPEQRARIERAALLVALGNVQRVTDQAYAVISQSRPDVVYTISVDTWRDEAGACECPDSVNRPTVICSHRWAIRLTLIAQERQRRLDIRAALSDVELERLRQFKARYQAQTA